MNLFEGVDFVVWLLLNWFDVICVVENMFEELFVNVKFEDVVVMVGVDFCFFVDCGLNNLGFYLF